MKVTGAISLYVHACTSLCRLAAVSAVAALLCMSVMSCSDGGKRGDERTPEHEAALKSLDDSIFVKSEYVMRTMREGMANAADSLDYYDFYLRWLRYRVSLDSPDTMRLNWDGPFGFLKRQKPTPRVRGMMGFFYNAKGSYYHKFHYNPHETIDLYHKSYECIMGSDMEYRLPDVCANLGDAYVAVNDMPHAAMWYRRALYLSDSLRLPKETNVSLYMGLGRIYLNLGDFKEALRCYQVSDRNFGLMPLNLKLYFLNNYGNYYYYAEDYPSALAIFLRLKKLLEQSRMEQSYEMYLCKVNMADVYLNLGNMAEAYRYLDEAETFFGSINDDMAIYYCHTIRIGLALKKGDVNEVRRILEAEKINTVVDFNLVNIRQRYLREYYAKTGNYKKAYENLMGSIERNDSLKHNTANMRTSEIMMRYTQDTLKLHHQIVLQGKDADIRRVRWVMYVVALAAVMLVLLFLYLLTYMRKRRLQTYMQLMQLKLANARSRISPHFIFNVLNNSISKTGSRDADELMALTKLIRANLKMSDKYYVSLKEELGFVRYYISVERSSIGDDFEFSIEAPPDDVLQNVMVPSMFIQILVENAIKHGLKRRAGHKSLRVSVVMEGSRCNIAVTDNGAGFDIRHSDPNSTGTGLKVIRSSINIINRNNKRKIRLGIRNLTGDDGKVAGCEVSLSLPLGLKNS